MGSKYPRSMRGCLPLWTLILEAALIVIFFFFANYDSSSQDPKKIVVTHGAILQDVMVMAALGMGFLTSSLWRYGWSSVAFNLFMLALGVQWAVLLDGFLEHPPSWKVVIKLSRIQQATMSAMSVLISAGAILGKANLAQLVLMVLMEVTAFSAMRMISRQFLVVCFNRVLGIHDTCGVHYTFGLPGLLGGIAYIGLMVHKISWSKNTMLGFQVLFDTGVLSLSMAMGLASGLITGLILNLKIWKAPHVAKYFDDQAFWEFPHLAVGF
ncbi:blood group Rh(CE) polypeptide isoform X4 [Myotis lucifugus]|uniref:blood group Rh(CE) polypeptide isoform X4 n=1 Tax=Myotis lucifugus TaxID=59463 RepID=UPI0003C47BDC|nr:blood group Rh(CE) polypeptide isoform X4 [Myotis lucifugus]